MSYAKLNIWVRDKNCRIVKRTGHLHIYNCLGEQIFFGWVIVDGHTEVKIPPGCYIVRAGMRGGNIYTDRAIVIARCDDEICLNLILPEFVEKERMAAKHQMERKLLAGGGCVPPILVAFGVEALRKNVNVEDIMKVFNVLMDVANINVGEIIRELEVEIEDIHQHLDDVSPEEAKELREYMSSLNKLKEILKKSPTE